MIANREPAAEGDESMEETSYLMRSPKNAARVSESIAEIESGKARKKKLIE
jgi:antitoxin YefM